MTEITTSEASLSASISSNLKNFLNVGCVVLQPEKIENAVKNHVSLIFAPI